jgi:diguanylate cyclase (GGDEF)-like protein/putative nucleotidyltransferase with HDIG domain
MSYRAWAYIWGVLLAGAAFGVCAYAGLTYTPAQWLAFVVFTALATLAQLFVAEAPNHVVYYATPVFVFAAVLLLPPLLFILLVLTYHAVEWTKERITNGPNLRAWYLQPFNAASDVLAGITARWMYEALAVYTPASSGLGSVLNGVAAALIFLAFNNMLLGLALVLARGKTWRDTGLLDAGNFLSELILPLLGYVVAVLWQLTPWLILPALSPLVLMYQALLVPKLKQEAETDGKTGLLNARSFAARFAAEFEHATRLQRPFALIMADLDFLRTINNTYGHLAGDAVLAGIGQIIRATIRGGDIASRFGGEEFSIVLPATSLAEAQQVAERLRAAVETMSFEATTSATPIRATMSFGIACYPQDAGTTEELTHLADIAVYHAKDRGRNLVMCAADLPHAVRLNGAASTSTACAPASPPPPATVAAAIAPAPASPSPLREAAPQATRPYWGFTLFVGGVVAAGALVAVLSASVWAEVDWATVALLAALALAAELAQIDLYRSGSLSVSVALAFAAALIGGLPGIVCVSAAIAVGSALSRVMSDQRQGLLYRTAFNWATHVLAGVIPAVVLRVTPALLQVAALHVNITLLVGAALSYFLIDTCLIAAAISISAGKRWWTTWEKQFRWLAGHYLALCVLGLVLGIAYYAIGWLGILVFTLPILMMRYALQQYVAKTGSSVREFRRMNEELTQANSSVVVANNAIHQLNDELFLTLAKIIDARDPSVSSHGANVAQYAVAIATELRFEAGRVEVVRQAGLLHDVGKVAISEQVLQKPGKLTAEEYEHVKTHAAIGADFLATSQGLRHLAPFVRHHHERWDGRGYPGGLHGEAIPLEARILAVADAIDVMASDRPYRRALPREEVVAELRRCAGAHFDPAVVAAWLSIVARGDARPPVSPSAYDDRGTPGMADMRALSESGALMM